jgi:hypothetical protein
VTAASQPLHWASGRLARAAAQQPRHELGRGLSAVVYRQETPTRVAAIKVFRGHWSADVVHSVLNGAPNPYSWCEDAAQCALYRRRILAELVPFWFGDKLTVARAHSIAFNEDAGAWEMDTDFVAAHAAALHHPFGGPRDTEIDDLRRTQSELQRRLMAAGFVGLTWQAGLSNPVAANNFLTRDRRHAPRGSAPKWCWIDLESGVPALFPINPFRLLSHYGRWSWRLSRPLFDDVVTGQLDDYLRAEASAIDAARGPHTARRLRQWARHLDEHQAAWWGRSRLERGVESALARGRITAQQAAAYRRTPGLWLAAEAKRACRAGGSAAVSVLGKVARRLNALSPTRGLRRCWRFARSLEVRRRTARAYALRRVRTWRDRGQLGDREARYLSRFDVEAEHATYLTDFAAHIAIKPLYKVAVWLGAPVLAQADIVSFTTAGLAIVFGGSIARSLYTSSRCASDLRAGRSAPWLALLVGTAPVVGSVAFPLQLLRSSAGPNGRLAGFLIYDALTTIGRRVPIWGGIDTGTEHFFNRLGDLIVRRREPLFRSAR